MEDIYRILQERRPEYDFRESDNFIDDELLDSFDIIILVSELEKFYHISIDAMDVVSANFENIDNIINLVKKSGGKL